MYFVLFVNIILYSFLLYLNLSDVANCRYCMYIKSEEALIQRSRSLFNILKYIFYFIFIMYFFMYVLHGFHLLILCVVFLKYFKQNNKNNNFSFYYMNYN